MSWFVDEKKVERRGAISLLQVASNRIELARSIQHMLESGQSIWEASEALYRKLYEQNECIYQLKQGLSACQSETRQLDSLIATYQRDLDPNYQRIEELEQELKEQTRLTEQERTAAADLREQLERAQNWHAQEAQELQQKIQELNRLVARQHKRLEELTGPASPE